MKTRLLIHVGAIMAIATAAGVFGTSVDVDSTTDALAADDTMTLTIQCSQESETIWVPSIAYTLDIGAASVALAQTDVSHSVTAVLTGNVNSDTDPTVTTVVDSGATKLGFYHGEQQVKVSGLACTTNTTAALGTMNTSTANSSNFNASFVGPAATAYASANQVDVASMKFFFGASGLIGAALSDGSDADSAQNGEVVFGPSQFRIASELVYLGNITDDATGETIKVTIGNM